MNGHIKRVTSPAPRDVWMELVQRDPSALVSQTPAWVDALCASGGYRDASRLYETADGRQLVLPMVRRTRRPAGLATGGSFPYGWGIGGLVTGDGAPCVEDIAAVFADLGQQRELQISIRPNPLHGPQWAAAAPPGVVRIPRVAHVLDLEGGFEHVWATRFKGTKRTAVRKAEKSGVEVECDTTGRLVPVFYALWEQALERWAAQQHEPVWLARLRGHQRDPIRKFQNLAAHLGASFQIWVARLNGEPVAANIVLQGANAHYTRGAINQELAGPVRASDLLHRMAIEDACRAGCRYYHMGETGRSSSLAQFKEGFGAVPYEYAEYRVERLPITAMDQRLRGMVKQAIGFRDA